jgi:Bacterial cadherin-like domain
MRPNNYKATLVRSGLAASLLLMASGAALAQSVTLTAAPTSTTLPDGQSVPMWGYACGTGTAAATGATCAAANPNAVGWSPAVITVAPGPLTVNLINNLPRPPGATAGLPTSLVIVGQLGGGLGGAPTRTTSPVHAAQGATWPIVAPPDTGGSTAGNATFHPPAQLDRVQSFATEVAQGATTALTWTNLQPGTYLIESGTHPSIQGPMGLYGVLVVTTPPNGATAGIAYPAVGTTAAVNYNAELPLLLSEIDPVQNAAVAAAVATTGFSEATVWSGLPGGCGNAKKADGTVNTTYQTCYPPAVNYDPRYYLINGVAFDRTNLANSQFATAPATGVTGTVLVRFVNAGLRMHVPSIVGGQYTPVVSSGTPTAVAGFALIAEDGNILPGTRRIQSEVFLAAGKTYDVMIDAPAAGAAALPVFDRELSLSNNNQRGGGMQAYISANGGSAAAFGAVTAKANADSYSVVAGNALTVSDPAKGLLANDVGIYGVKAVGTVVGLVLNSDGTFTYSGAPITFTYCGNGATSGAACSTVTVAACAAGCMGGAPVANADSYASNIASRLQIAPPGVLGNDTDPADHPLTAAIVGTPVGGTVALNPDGSFTAVPTAPPIGAATATVTFSYNAVNSQNTPSAAPATVTVTFGGGSGLAVNVKDAPTGLPITDYRWIIEEDRTFKIDPNQVTTGPACTSPGVPAGCTPTVSTLGVNFHTSYMPLVAAGCVGVAACESGQALGGQPAVCDIGNGACRTTTAALAQQAQVLPSQAHLDPTKRYYITIFPGDAGNSFVGGGGATVQVNPSCDPNTTTCAMRQFSIAADCGPYAGPYTPASSSPWAPAGSSAQCGHGMGGSPIAAAQSTVNVTLEQTPFAPTKVAVFVFEDDSPLNGEQDVHGGTETFGTSKEPGLGGFMIRLFDDAGGPGDATGQMTYDMFNMPLSNSLAGTKDPLTGNDACPITAATDGLVGMIVTCPHFESDGSTVSPLEGQAVIANMMPGRYGVQATPGADRIGRGEEWLQTNTLDGQKAHDSFIKVGGPAYFQEFGPAGYHVAVGMANPKIINGRLSAVCANQTCNHEVKGRVVTARMSRTPDQRLYGSGSYDAFAFTNCYVSLGDPDDDDIAFTKCNPDGTFDFKGLPPGDWRVTVFDQWNDFIVDGLSTPVRVNDTVVDMGDVKTQQWHTDIYTRSFFDQNGDGVSNLDTTGTACTAPNVPAGCNANYGNSTEPGLALVPTNIRFRDGSYSNFNNTDLNGFAGFNEIFPLFNWYVIEADTTRYKQTGVHVVYDAGGPADGTPGGSNSLIASNLANTTETNHLPTNLRVPGAVYCANADCTDITGGIKAGPGASAASPSTGRIDPPWVTTEGWQGFIGESEFVEFGKAPFAAGENGGIKGEVIYASTRPFDDPALLIHTSWTPNVPGVTINLYQETTSADGTQTLKLVDTTKTTSWDDWAQGFRSDGMPNMNCPGQDPNSLFAFTLRNTTQGLNPTTSLPNNSLSKCYDGFAMFNQVQPAQFDGAYQFPSVAGRDPHTGVPTGGAGSVPGTDCKICVANAVDHLPMLPPGKYVVEMIVPPGYELVKEEDKNILIGDNYIAPVNQQFAGLGSIFILPDQAAVNATYNANNAQNPTTNLGSVTFARHEGDTGSVETFWPCVGAKRIVPDFISLFPGSQEVAPFAGASRNLCDRKEVTLEDQSSALAKFWVFTSAHVAAHFTGIVLDDFSSEFDPFSPQFGEKFAVYNVPVSFKDHNGIEVSRTYTDQWGMFNGLNYSTWEVNPPNPTGYAPTMMVTCMNDPGPIPGPNGTMITDPLYNPDYSQFCYEIPFMPGQTQYMDTPVVPTSAFAEGYNHADCDYPDATPAIARVDGDTHGPYVSAAGHTLYIRALGDQAVPNNAYSGPSATKAPFNQKTITRHYGFGGTQGTGSVTIGGVTVPVTGWSDGLITVTVPATVPLCNASNPTYRGDNAAARCGELVITAGNGKQSIDAVTVTVGGTAPKIVNPGTTIQAAIDAATPGDLIIVDGTLTQPSGAACTVQTAACAASPTTYNEMVVMWKPVRLQGVGAASVAINANTHPSGKIDSWRRQVECLFGLSLNGGTISGTNPFDPNGQFSCPTTQRQKADPIPLEPLVGWDPTLNGNLAELLQEPTLLGAYEGAGITVLAKGVTDASRDNCTLNGVCTPLRSIQCPGASTTSPFVGNFLCNPSRIDGLSVVNSSQGGGGIFVHGWSHDLEVSNNRVHSNGGTLTGGITVGQSEVPDATLVGTRQVGFAFNNNVNVHHNAITRNASYGDELNSTTPSAGGGVTFCPGADGYEFTRNWVCGNISSGDGGGVVHLGFSTNGTIANNQIIFNSSTNPTIPTHGGGITVMGAPPDGPVCENQLVDQDCPPTLTDGTGPGLVIDSNLIMGNSAESGSGGGLRLENVNGSEVARNPTSPQNWYSVSITNNIISNNVAGWDGGGVSLQDALVVNLINNTIVSNDATGSAGVLFNTLGAANANNPPPGCTPQPDPNLPQNPSCINPVVTSTPQPAGLVVQTNTSNLIASLPATINCPAGHPSNTANGACRSISYPLLQNDLIYQNRAFNIQVGGLGTGPLEQQNLVTLLPQLNQTATGSCPTTTNYWDIGVRGDTAANNHGSGFTLAPNHSILTDPTLYGGASNQGAPVNLVSQYCNGSRVPPENGGLGYGVPPGISDATLPNPVFNLTPSATVDEGNNWVNLSYGPLTLTSLSGATLGNYSISAGSTAINDGLNTGAPNHDFFGTTRPQGGTDDIGAVELPMAAAPIASVTGGPLAFGNVPNGSTSGPLQLVLHNTGNANLTGITLAFSATQYSRPAGGAGGTCGATLPPAAGTCTINVVFHPTALGPVPATLTITGNVAVTGSPVTLSGTGITPGTVSITPNPLSITLATGTFTNTGTVTLTNTSPAGGAAVAVSNVAVSGGSVFTWFFNLVFGANNCTGANLAPGATCTVGVRFTNVTSARGVDRTGAITFTDNATGSPQAGVLTGHAN